MPTDRPKFFSACDSKHTNVYLALSLHVSLKTVKFLNPVSVTVCFPIGASLSQCLCLEQSSPGDN